MRTSLQIVLAALFIFNISCRKDLEVVIPNNEHFAVYCLINPRDTAQYVRIDRLFTSSDDPYQYVSLTDSIHIDPESVSVIIEESKEGVIKRLIPLFPSNDYQKDEGLFTGEGYFTYKTTSLLYGDRDYTLRIEDQKTGSVMSATVAPIGNRNLEYSFRETRYYNLAQYVPEALEYDGSLNPGQFEKRLMRLLYYEYSDTDTAMKVVDWRYTWNKDYNEDTTFQLSRGFLEHIASNISPSPGIYREAIGVDKIIILNDAILTSYIEYIDDMTPAHYIPQFTNFNTGAGIFASRYYYTYFALKLKDATLDSLAYGEYTKNLGFLDSNGNLIGTR